MMTLEHLVARLEQCERDSARHLGPSVASRLGHWRGHCQSAPRLATFVRGFLYRSSLNGWALHQKGGLTLEAVVIECGAPLFALRDVEHARQTLGLAATGPTARR